MNDSSDNEDEQQKISVRFVLAPKQSPTLEVPADAIAIPSNLRRRGLSTLVNHMLGRKVSRDDNDMDKEAEDDQDDEDENALPAIRFDFILNGKLLRMGVEAAVRRDGLSMEESVEIQYFCAQEAPSSSGESETLPDWISALSFNACNMQPFLPKEGLLFSGCYDGTIRALEAGSCATLTSTKAHTSAIKCMDTMLMTGAQDSSSVAGQLMVATGSMDQTLLTHVLTESKKSGKPKLKLHGVFSGGHQNAVESLALVQKAQGKVMMASGDWDGQLCFWNVPTSPDDEATASNKKRKTESGGKKAVLNAPEIMPSASIKAHASGVSGISWGLSDSHLITSSWDHSAKVWDVERQESILSLVGSRVVSTMDRCSNSNIIATGHPDCTVRLWDMRVDTKQTSSRVNENSLKPSHKAWVSALKWSPTQPHVMATTSHDGTVKMWDIRSSLPLHSARAQDKGSSHKGLSLAFAEDGHALYTGGSDCRVKKFSC